MLRICSGIKERLSDIGLSHGAKDELKGLGCLQDRLNGVEIRQSKIKVAVRGILNQCDDNIICKVRYQ